MLEPNSEHQHLLLNAGAPVIVMRLIRELRGEISELENSELEESERQSLKEQLHTVIVLSHNFLQAFCYLNKACQDSLFEHLEPIIEHLALDVGAETTILNIFKENHALCMEFPEHLIRTIVDMIEERGSEKRLLSVLAVSMKADGRLIKRNQNNVLRYLCEPHRTKTVVLFNTEEGMAERAEMVRSCTYDIEHHEVIGYHLQLLRLLVLAAEGKNGFSEAKCQELLSLKDVARHMEALTALNSLRMKEPFVRFLNDAYLDTEHVLSSSEDNRSILTLFQAFRLDVDNLVSDEYVDPEEASYVTTAKRSFSLTT